MNASRNILIGRCSFWPEARNPEAWLRALVALDSAAKISGTQPWHSPRAVGEGVLRSDLSRRGVPGLFGLDCEVGADKPAILHGLGLLELNAALSTWQLSAEAQELLAVWQSASHRQAMEALALLILRRSVWLRLALLKLQAGVWQLVNWDQLKAANGQLRVGKNLVLANDSNPADWLMGLAEPALGDWWRELSHAGAVTIEIHAPKTAKPEDGMSLAPLKAPFYLLDSLGWLDSSGRLNLPDAQAQELTLRCLAGPKVSPMALLDQVTASLADQRGVFPLEPVMLRFAQALELFPRAAAKDSAFIAWTDRLLTESFRAGVIELFSAEPGQPRHGRGLLGDAQQKLLRWRVHPGFDEICASVTSDFHQSAAVVTL